MNRHSPSRRLLIRQASIALVAATVALVPAAAKADTPPPGDLTFEKDILPIFEARCLGCHAGESPKAGLDLRTKGLLLQGGQTGPAVRIGASQASLIWEKIVADQMPLGISRQRRLTRARQPKQH